MNIIISRYNEDLSWTLEFPFNQFKYIVYNKGINESFEKTNVIQVISLPNIGRCDQTYLYHIVSNYNKLSDIVIFLPGSINMDYKKINAIKLLFYILKTKKANFIGENTTSIFQLFKYFSLTDWVCQNTINQELNNESTLFLCPQRPFGNWFSQHGFKDVQYYCYYGIFSVDKLDILQHPIQRYKQLLRELSVHSNPEVGHYIERAWASIFGPFKYTIFNGNEPIKPVKKNQWKRKSLLKNII
jgi:hypothetical protein